MLVLVMRAEAVATPVHLCTNQMVTTVLKSGETPYQQLYLIGIMS